MVLILCSLKVIGVSSPSSVFKNFKFKNTIKGFDKHKFIKNLPVSAKDTGSILDLEDPLEKEMANHSILAWEIPWIKEPGRLQSTGSQKSQTQFSN